MTVRVLLREEKELDSRARRVRWAEFFFLFVGLLALDYYIWVSLDATFYQAYESWSFDRELKGQPASFRQYLEDQVDLLWSRISPRSQSAEESKPMETPTPSTGVSKPRDGAGKAERARTLGESEAKPLSVVGRIEVPRLRLTAMVREGTDEATLRRAVGHISSTPLPGQPGNVGLAGHRDTFFRQLRNIKNSDRIVVSTLHGDYDYQVESVKIVTPKDVNVLKPSPGEQLLTLVTCYPFNYVGSAPKRFIVRAKLVEPSPPQPTGF